MKKEQEKDLIKLDNNLFHKTRIILSGVLATAMLMSSAACGKTEETVQVDNYGTEGLTESVAESSTNSQTGTGTESDASSSTYDTANGSSLREFFGEKLEWKDTIPTPDGEIKVDTTYMVPTGDLMNAYECTYVDSGLDQEEAIVRNLFGDTAEKLEEITYTNNTEFIPFLYRMRSIMSQWEEIDMDTPEQEIFDKFYSAINADNSYTYKWSDDADKYFHFYKGKYNGVDYGLILGYDYLERKRYIVFEPVNIDDVYPDKGYKTLMVESSKSIIGKDLDYENECALKPGDVKHEAADFLQKKLNLNRNTIYLAEDGVSSRLADTYNSAYSSNEGISVLSFSDADYISTEKAMIPDGAPREMFILAEQRDLAAEGMKEHNTDYWSYMNGYKFSNVEEANVTRDGYAVYLVSPFDTLDGTNVDDIDDEDESSNQSAENNYDVTYLQSSEMWDQYFNTSSNSGIIMVNDMGIYGVNLEISNSIDNIVENVKLLDFEQIKECAKTEISENFNVKTVGGSASIPFFNLTYYPVKDKNDTSKVTYIPTWQIIVSGNSGMSLVLINAVDGSIIREE